MTNSHAESLMITEGERWKPVPPPCCGEDLTAFHASMLMPGMSIAFHAAALGRSRSSVTSYQAAAIEAARRDPAVMVAVDAAVRAMCAEHALQMARLRGTAQLPFWSRLAIGEYRKRGFSRREVAIAFQCSLGTVANVLQGKGSGYGLFLGERRLTQTQRNPPGKKRPGARKASAAPDERTAANP